MKKIVEFQDINTNESLGYREIDFKILDEKLTYHRDGNDAYKLRTLHVKLRNGKELNLVRGEWDEPDGDEIIEYCSQFYDCKVSKTEFEKLENFKLYIDTETTGLESTENGITQLSILMENEKGELVETFDEYIRPAASCIITQTALEIQGISRADLETDKYQEEKIVAAKLKKFLEKYQEYQLTIIGYNVDFDIDFLNSFLRRNNIKFDTTSYQKIDVLEIVRSYHLNMYNSLTNACEHFGINLENAHNSLADITATRYLYQELEGM